MMAASLVKGLRENSCLTNFESMEARPSEVFSATLPVKPSVTTTSTKPSPFTSITLVFSASLPKSILGL